MANAESILKAGGFIFFEIGYHQAKEVLELMNEKFEDIEVTKDYAGCDRIISGRLVSHG